MLSSFVSIFNNDFGRNILLFSVSSAVIFLLNAIISVLSKAMFEFYFNNPNNKNASSKKKK